MTDLSDDILRWMRITDTGVIGLMCGMTESEVLGELVEAQETRVDERSRRFLHTTQIGGELSTTVEAYVVGYRLSEMSVDFSVYSSPERGQLLELIARELDQVGMRQGGSSLHDPYPIQVEWASRTTMFRLTASGVDVLDEGMPISVRLRVRWVLGGI